LVVVAGEKGLGKSLLTNARLVAELTRGTLDGELHGTPVDALVATAEDDWETVVKPRLMAHGADLDRVHRVEIEDANGDPTLTLPNDVPALDSAIEGLRSVGRVVGILVIDPIGAFLSETTDSHREASVRRALAPLASFAMRRDLAVVVVAHLNKDESKRLIARVTGAGAFVNAPRSVLAFARNPDDPNGEQGTERVIAQVASNWGAYSPSLSVTVESRLITLDDESVSDVGYLTINGESSIGVDDLQRGGDDGGVDCEEAIAVALEHEGKPSREVKATVVAELGCSRPTVERAARRMVERGELIVEASGFPRRTTWTLAAASTAVTSSPVPIRDATGANDATEPSLDSQSPQSHHVPGHRAREGDATTEPEP
jgi:hypothetical protein